LVFGLLVIVPPQSYFGLLHHTDVSISYLEWYPSFFRPNASDLDGYFMGGFALGHLWFVVFLFLFSLLALPLFLYLRRRESGKQLVHWLAGFFSLPGTIFLLAIPLFVMAWLLDFYPNPLYFIAHFAVGFLLVADARFEKAIGRHKAIALVLGPVLYLYVAYLNTTGWPGGIPSWFGTIIDIYVRGFAPWFFVIAILGYGRSILSTRTSFLAYSGQASYPVYLLHQTAIVIIGYYVVQWNTGILIKYATILVAAIVVSILIYDLLVKRTKVTRVLFGMRLK
jgi:peptidoglycan/LPS O-acetylase OafA/YrhL